MAVIDSGHHVRLLALAVPCSELVSVPQSRTRGISGSGRNVLLAGQGCGRLQAEPGREGKKKKKKEMRRESWQLVAVGYLLRESHLLAY